MLMMMQKHPKLFSLCHFFRHCRRFFGVFTSLFLLFPENYLLLCKVLYGNILCCISLLNISKFIYFSLVILFIKIVIPIFFLKTHLLSTWLLKYDLFLNLPFCIFFHLNSFLNVNFIFLILRKKSVYYQFVVNACLKSLNFLICFSFHFLFFYCTLRKSLGLAYLLYITYIYNFTFIFVSLSIK
uniref:Uncharacterized protein n=1 Tax=Lutzomyia longipalpis TaxID=7200 RepID=A0A7G3B842_LUTLO